jgi:hypothetical protein
MKVRLKRSWSKAYPELTVGNVYRVFEDSNEYLRIISDAGEPILFNRKAFEFVDPAQPSDWISERGEEGELYAAPRELQDPPCFFEKWHDHDWKVQTKFTHYVYELCRAERALMADPPNRFIRVHRRPGNAVEPIMLFSELDEERWEVRKVEVFADGRLSYANERGSFGMTKLGDQPVPALEVLAANAEFELAEITRAEFDEIFEKALTAEEAAQFETS